MRIRRKPWTEPELAQSPVFISDPDKYKGRWKELYPEISGAFHIELGCGKCVSTAQMAYANPSIRYLAIDEVRTVLAVGCRLIRRNMPQDAAKNLLLTCADACDLDRVLAPEDGVSRIYIAFPNPWNKHAKHHKRRLTHPRQLESYRKLLCSEGEIWFKTDDEELYRASKRYFAESGYQIRYETEDLAASGFSPNYISEHERVFREAGKPIRFLIARMTENTLDKNEDMEETP